MTRAWKAELIKSRRRRDLLLVAGIGLIALIWASGGAPSSADERDTAYSALFYALPVIHTVVMPTGLACLACRLWDAETKGSTCKLLFTLQSRDSLYLAKTGLGFLYLLLLSLVETGGLLALAKIQHFTEPLSLKQLLWLMLCTLTVNTLLFVLFSLFAARGLPPVALVGAGLACSLCGLMSAFLPQWVTWFLPFAYYLPLDAIGYTWDFTTRIATYFEGEFRFWMLGLSFAITVIVFFLGRRVVETKEV